MKLFTISEAERLLPSIIPRLAEIKEMYSVIDGLRSEARSAAESAGFSGGMTGGTLYINTLYQIGKLTTEVHDLGIEIKDPSTGLIDFPSMRGDRMILLC